MDEKKPRWYQGKVADMLRASGYVPLPRMWVTKEQYRIIAAMAKENANHVNAVRMYCRDQRRKLDAEDQNKP